MRPPRPTLSRLVARGRVGPNFFARAGALRTDDAPAPTGLVDRLEDLAQPGLDLALVHPALHPFLLDAPSLALRVESTWHGPFALVWLLVRPLLVALGQLALPWRRAKITVRTVALDASRDGRSDVRGVLRLYPDGAAMQVMAYATHREGPAGYMSAAFPLPFCTLCGVLRLALLGQPEPPHPRGYRGALLTSAQPAGGAPRSPVGIWLAPRGLPAVPLPFGETLSLWAASDPSAPAELRGACAPDDTLVGRHEQTLFGLRFATHRYWFSPARP